MALRLIVDLELDDLCELEDFCLLEWEDFFWCEPEDFLCGDAIPVEISVTDNAATSTLFIKVPLSPLLDRPISQAILITIPESTW